MSTAAQKLPASLNECCTSLCCRKLLALATKSSSFNEGDAGPPARPSPALPGSSSSAAALQEGSSSQGLPETSESLPDVGRDLAAPMPASGLAGPFAGSGRLAGHSSPLAESSGVLGDAFACEPALAPAMSGGLPGAPAPGMSRNLSRALSKHYIRLPPTTSSATAPPEGLQEVTTPGHG
jgi:hypothetical protein